MSSSAARVQSPSTRTYFGWQRERVAFLFGMSGQRAGMLVAAALLAVWPLAVSRMGLAILCWPVAAVLAGLVFARLGGRTIDEWATAFVSFQVLRTRQQHKFLSGAFRPPAIDDGHVVVLPWSSEHRSGRGEAVDPLLAGADGREPVRVGGFAIGGYRPQPESPRATPAPAAAASPRGERPDKPGRNKDGGGSSDNSGGGRRKGRGGRAQLWRRWPRAEGQMDLPGVLAPLTILEGPSPLSQIASSTAAPGGGLAVVHHRLDRTYTAVARVRFPGIGLVDSFRRETRVSGWGSLLAGLCTESNPIVRMQTLQRISPASGAALRRWHGDHVGAGAPPIAVEVTADLLDTAGVSTSQRESFLVFTMDARRASTAIRGAGGGTAAAATVLNRHLRALSSSIAGADLQIESWLGPRDLAEVIRTAYDPHASRDLAERRAAAAASLTTMSPLIARSNGLAAGIPPALAGPAAALTRAGSYQHDGAHSVTYWVHDWPRSQVHATVLGPLLGESVHRRSVSMHLEPLGPRAAERDVMRERTARSVAVRMRQRTGQIVPEHEQVALDRARAQDVDRAAGHGLVRFTAYVTVTVIDEAQLEEACAELEADAAIARIELRRMWFAMDVGFAMGSLPLGFGLPTKRW